MKSYTPYNCKQCGKCCTRVDLVEQMSKYDRGDGVCKHLLENNKCEIYSHRPDLCNGQYVYENFYSHMTISEYHKMISGYCDIIRRNDVERLYKDKSSN